jgi:hypothetical protein
MKGWIDPDSPEGKAKIVKACIALRNHDGGVLLIGFNNQTGASEKNSVLADVRAAFHIDKIQGLVSKHCSEPFEVEVRWVDRTAQEHPVIIVPSGVRAPVAVRSPIAGSHGVLLAEHRVYIRSLQSNNTPSTTEATWQDWAGVVGRCFENREADIGRFIRRHLTPDAIRELLNAAASLPPPSLSLEDQARAFLVESAGRFDTVRAELSYQLPPHGWREVAAVTMGPLNQMPANKAFLNLLASSNPKYTGWPVWLDSRGFHGLQPYIYEGAWETALLAETLGHMDFWRATGSGKFYHRRALEDDTAESRLQGGPKPGTVLDFGLVVYRTAESIAVPLAFVQAMGGVTEETALAFSFRWSGLKGRKLSSWADPGRMLWSEPMAHQDEYSVTISVPIDTSKSAISAYTNQVVQPLFAIFDGFELEERIVGEMVDKMLSRTW